MAIGRKSIIMDIIVFPSVVRVQANKNHGICDIILGQKVLQDKKKVFVPERRMGEVLTMFQGRQFDDELVIERLQNTLTEILNSNK